MEDLVISPWENYESHNNSNLFESRQKSATSKDQNPSAVKSRQIQTQQNDQSRSPIRRQYFRLESIQKRTISSSTHQSFFNENRYKRPSRLQIKLVAFPIQQNPKQRKTAMRLTQNFDGKSTFLNQSFEVIETIFNSELKQTKVFKQRLLTKKITLNETVFKTKNQQKNLPRVSESLCRIKAYMYENYEPIDQKLQERRRCKNHQFKFILEDKQKLKDFEYMKKKHSFHDLKLNKIDKIKIQHIELPEFNRTLDEKKMPLLTSDIGKYDQDKLEKLVQKQKKQNKLSIQKLENINCFRDTTNIFNKLKKKNKVLFNELERYNLFGLKNINIKNKTLQK